MAKARREMGFDFSPEHNERLKGVSRMRSLEILLEIGGISLTEAEMINSANRKNACMSIIFQHLHLRIFCQERKLSFGC
jgi:hypothetical protein